MCPQSCGFVPSMCTSNAPLLNVFLDSLWAGRQTNRKQTTKPDRFPYSRRGGPVTGSRPWLRFHYRPLPPRCPPLGLLCSPQRRGTKLRLLPPSPRLSFPASASCCLTARAVPSCPAQPVTHVLIVPTSSPQTTYSASQKWKSSKTPPPSLAVKRLLRHHPHAVLQHCDP